jgi:ABC-type nitrate/sulfonate/bicarbonate transport system permease component
MAEVPVVVGRSATGRTYQLASLMRRWLLGLLGLALTALVWQVVALALQSPVLPSLTSCLAAVGGLFSTATLQTAILPSVSREAIGYTISALIGIVGGLLLGYRPKVAQWCLAVMNFLRAVPFPLLLPVLVLVLGIGTRTVVTLIVLGSIWPVLINTYDGARSIDPLVYDVVRVCNLPTLTAFRRVWLPATLPQMMAGLRVALGMSLAILVIAEMIGSSDGLGHLIETSETSFDSAQTFAGVIFLGLLGWTADTLFLTFERRVIGWSRH